MPCSNHASCKYSYSYMGSVPPWSQNKNKCPTTIPWECPISEIAKKYNTYKSDHFMASDSLASNIILRYLKIKIKSVMNKMKRRTWSMTNEVNDSESMRSRRRCLSLSCIYNVRIRNRPLIKYKPFWKQSFSYKSWESKPVRCVSKRNAPIIMWKLSRAK